MHIHQTGASPESHCERILRTLPGWFGVEESLLEYVADSARYPTFLSTAAEPIGFITVREHFPTSWEIHCIAVHADARGRGVGRLLVNHAEGWLAERGGSLLQVKTLAASHPSKEYEQTRQFYAALGFTPLEVFPSLWSERHPVLQLVKVLAAPKSAA